MCQAILETGNQCPAVGYNKTIYLCFHPLPIPMVARITKYLNKYEFDLPDHGFFYF
jgi:hypothetical protein